MKKKQTTKCDIRALTKLRNGYDNWWCYTHYSSARGTGGKRLSKCLKADAPVIQESEKIYVDISQYLGGVGIWGALEAVYDSKRETPESGVHVHLRRELDGEKEVDKTFKEVYIKVLKGGLFNEMEWVKIDETVAKAYTASNVFNKELTIIHCKHCGKEHIDSDYFAVHPHKKHFCTFCGRDFIDVEHGISNPIFGIKEFFGDAFTNRTPIKVGRKLVINQQDYPGGIQIWGSNPAIIWSAPRPEESGIHVHLFNSKNSPPCEDETYGHVEIDNIVLDDDMIRHYMVQKSLQYLRKYLISLQCPHCKSDHFDQGDKALNPHKVHDCENCNKSFSDNTRLKGTVSNPIIQRLADIGKNAASLIC